MKKRDLSLQLAVQLAKLTEAFFISQNNGPHLQQVSPLVRASCAWRIVSEQLQDLLGKEIHRQWFQRLRPVVIAGSVLVIQAPDKMTCHWVSRHYQGLIDLLLSAQDQFLCCIFVEGEDLTGSGPHTVVVHKAPETYYNPDWP